MMYEEFQDRVGELITGIIQQSDNRYTLVQLRDRVEALLPRSEQVYSERYDHGMRVKAVITDVSAEGKGPSVVVSRKSPELIKKLFELEVPEIADELVEVVGVAREPGFRSKIAVVSHADGVDPVGACVGPRGSRVRMVVSELRGEKIDIIPYNEEPARFVAKALSPARVREVLVDDEERQATVIVPDDQLSLAIGREGQNARLAAKLTGWRVDIVGETEFAERDEDEGFDGGGRGGLRRPLRRGALRRSPLPERLARRLALLRSASAPGARPLRDESGDGSRRSQRDEVDIWRRSPIRAPSRADRRARRRLRSASRRGRGERRRGRGRRLKREAEPRTEAVRRRRASTGRSRGARCRGRVALDEPSRSPTTRTPAAELEARRGRRRAAPGTEELARPRWRSSASTRSRRRSASRASRSSRR